MYLTLCVLPHQNRSDPFGGADHPGVLRDLVTIYQQIIIETVLLTVAAMTYDTEKLQQDPVR